MILKGMNMIVFSVGVIVEANEQKLIKKINAWKSGCERTRTNSETKLSKSDRIRSRSKDTSNPQIVLKKHLS